MTACIVGWAHTPFGKLDDDVESLITQVTKNALVDAGIDAADVDAVYLGFYNGGFSTQDFASSLVFQADPAFRFKPALRVENACATGSAAVHQAITHIESKRAKIVLVVGVEKMTHLPSPKVADILLQATYIKEESQTDAGIASLFSEIAQRYFQKYGDQSEALAKIAAKNHRNACLNPLAHIRKDLGFDFCYQPSEKNPYVAPPLKRTDCSLISDGAAALVLCDVDASLAFPKSVIFRGRAHVNDWLPMSKRDMTYWEGPAQAWKTALESAKLTLDDIDLVETHDCFTIAELLQYEAMGLTPKGQGARAILEGWTERDGRLPVNLSGGLKAKGHPIGATGVSMHVMAAMQLTGLAGEMQTPKPAEIAGTFNMGGMAVANYVSLLEPIRA